MSPPLAFTSSFQIGGQGDSTIPQSLSVNSLNVKGCGGVLANEEEKDIKLKH